MRREERVEEDCIVLTCYRCNKVRAGTDTDPVNGVWIELDAYLGGLKLKDAAHFQFRYGYCPECLQRLQGKMTSEERGVV